MKTITFYSYKGGVGRTLLLANIAKYLSRFGQKVFAIDFDLEAPGLHYKLGLNSTLNKASISKGVVDYVYSYSVERKKSQSLKDFVVEVEHTTPTGGSIHLMPAGNVPTANYWRQLAQLSWHDMFYSDEATGVPFFLELKARIKKEFSPDYLLIDSRTGITEIGGVATTILPEYVICLLLRNRENLEGAREVLRSIKRTLRMRNQEPVTIIPVVARLPVLDDLDEEQRIISEVQDFLNADAPDIADTLSIKELSVLHVDRGIEIEESILIEDAKPIEQSALLRDYIRLFAQIVPLQVIEPHVEPLVKEALLKAWDDPTRAERDLLALAEYASHSEPYRALLKFYRVRNAEKSKILRTAYKYWLLTGNTDKQLLWSVVKNNFNWREVHSLFKTDKKHNESSNGDSIPIRFIYDVWQAASDDNEEIGLELISAYSDLNIDDQAIQLCKRLGNKLSLTGEGITRILRTLYSNNDIEEGLEIAERHKNNFTEYYGFLRIWAELVVKAEVVDKAYEILRLETFTDAAQEQDLLIYCKLLLLVGDTKHMRSLLARNISNLSNLHYSPRNNWGLMDRYSTAEMYFELGKLYDKADLFSEFREALQGEMPNDEIEHLHRRIQRSNRGY